MSHNVEVRNAIILASGLAYACAERKKYGETKSVFGKELDMIGEQDYAYYASTLDDRLCLCQYRANNRRFYRSHARQRPYKVLVENSLPQLNIEPQPNAFSFYGTHEDYIIIMRDLVDFFAIILNDVSESQEQYTWMFHIVLYFCGFHEFGHLYLGHCQISPSCKMAMTFTEDMHGALTSKDVQAMEFEADMYATDQLADFVREKIKSKQYQKLWGYHSKDMFYSDAIKAICVFFSIIKYFEYREQKKKSLGKTTEYDHPSFLLREYLVGELFLTWMDKYGFGRKDNELIYNIIHNDTLFMKAPHDEKQIKYQYSAILDGSIKEHIQHVLVYCNEVLDKKTAKYARLKSSGKMTIKLS